MNTYLPRLSLGSEILGIMPALMSESPASLNLISANGCRTYLYTASNFASLDLLR